jgi:peptidoglycan/LPS O-acetylase OafA/YrhL
LINHSNNFTALRLFAAFLVLYGHSFDLYKVGGPSFMGWMPLGPLAVYIFFAISGYLISISWSRDSHVTRFIFKRALRIFPGLAACVLLSIFVLGAFTTTLPLAQYFADPVTLAYAKNILLNINYTLPGVFEYNAFPRAVNGSIWSLPVEFAMYLIFAFLSAILRVKWLQRVGMIGLAIAFFIAYYYVGMSEAVFYSFQIKYIAICGLYFLAGAIIHQWNLLRFISLSSIIAVIIIWLSLSRWPVLFEYASYAFLPFLVIGFGTNASRLFTWLDKFDYSYGIYIYAFPVQQLISLYFFERGHRFGLIASALATLCLAGLSWHLVEKPALQHKNLLKL